MTRPMTRRDLLAEEDRYLETLAHEFSSVTHENVMKWEVVEPQRGRLDPPPHKDLATDPSAVVYDDKATPFSLTSYREIETVTEEWTRPAARAAKLGRSLPASQQDAYYQLVRYQVEASANLYELRLAEFTDIRYGPDAPWRQAEKDNVALPDEVDPTVVVQQLVVDTGGLAPSYLGPPESWHR